MPKTVIEKVATPHPAVKVFKIGGTLGFHEKDTLTRLLQECTKRGIAKLVFDFSTLKSLGGGCAGILRDAANAGEISIGVAGASETTLQFLRKQGESCRIHFASTIEEVISRVEGGGGVDEDLPAGGSGALRKEFPADEHPADADTVAAKQTGAGAEEAPHANETMHPVRQSPDEQSMPGVICLGYDDDHAAGRGDSRNTDSGDGEDLASLADSVDAFRVEESGKSKSSGGSRLAKKLFHYDALLSISSEFNRISDVGRLLDTFLLTTMAQVGVEHAAFLELQEGVMTPIAARGIELDHCAPLETAAELWNRIAGKDAPAVIELANSPADETLRKSTETLGFMWAVPFMIYGELRGVVLLGRPIKKSLDEDSLDVLKLLVHHASIAYENKRRFEEVNYRSLGLIQTIISLIEEKNNLAGGSTFFVANYSYIVAEKMHYPAENISDLMFAVVLRDIGMIKVSDLILKNPRELNNEEWEIIKQHPVDGAEMLSKMSFSDHTVEIVLHHHERFNGEGYPYNLRGTEIPLGARIVSVVESFAAMLQNRSTRPALSQEEALNAIKGNWGMRYDPDVIRNFVEIIEQETRTGERVRYADNELFKNKGDLICRKVFS